MSESSCFFLLFFSIFRFHSVFTFSSQPACFFFSFLFSLSTCVPMLYIVIFIYMCVRGPWPSGVEAVTKSRLQCVVLYPRVSGSYLLQRLPTPPATLVKILNYITHQFQTENTRTIIDIIHIKR